MKNRAFRALYVLIATALFGGQNVRAESQLPVVRQVSASQGANADAAARGARSAVAFRPPQPVQNQVNEPLMRCQAGRGCDPEETAELTSPDPAPQDGFGLWVSIDGDVAVFASTYDDDGGYNSGSAWVFEREPGGSWTPVRKLTALDGEAEAVFGSRVDVNGDSIIVGAILDDDDGPTHTGAAYVFDRNQGGANQWGQVKKLTASDAQAEDHFGAGAAISGDTAVVGAAGGCGVSIPGAAYVFERDLGGQDNWGECAKLVAPDGMPGDGFGIAVAAEGDIVVVGAQSADAPQTDSGACYVFYRGQGAGCTWDFVKKLTASDASESRWFGMSVAIGGDFIVVGAPSLNSPAGNPGAAYIFEQDAGGADNWGEVKKLVGSSDPATFPEFGRSVSISGSLVVVGASHDNGCADEAVYVFHRNRGGQDNWGEVERIAGHDWQLCDHFASTVSISNRTAFVGAGWHADEGSVYEITVPPDADDDSIADECDNTPPVVSSVVASQRTDGSLLVDIYYDLADEDGDACTVSVLASDDAGATWNVPIAAVSGDIGSGITPGAGRQIVWDCAVDLPWTVGAQHEVRVCADQDDGLAPMVLVPGCVFAMGDPWDEGGTDERPVHWVWVSTFRMDKYEVTIAFYCQFLNYGGNDDHWDANQKILRQGSPGSYYYQPILGFEDHPVVYVNYMDITHFCEWRSAAEGLPTGSYRLPTEAEWEKAAGWDPALARHHRFGEHTDGCGDNCLDGHRANYSDSGDPFDNGTTRVGYYDGMTHGSYTTQDAESYYGCYDMSGNVWEWCNDWYLDTYYSSSPSSDPQGPGSGTDRVLRGGCWDNNASLCRSAIRGTNPPTDRHDFYGFRCAVSGDEVGSADSPPFPIDNLGSWCLGDMDCSGGTPTFDDIKYFSAAIGSESGWWAYYKSRHPQQEDPPCPWLAGDFWPPPGVEFSDIKPFAASIGQPCVQYVPPGACCLPSGGCIGNVTQADCGLFDGWWAGPLTACGDPDVCTGACCSSPAGCTYVSWPECGGDWLGPGSDCDPYPCGACCYDDGSCVLDGLTDCAGGGGSWQGPGTSCEPNICPQPGACCAADGTCTVTLEAACAGSWQGAGTDCDPNPCPQPVSCCFDDGHCEVLTDAACSLAGGHWWSWGAADCELNPCGACCRGDLDLEFTCYVSTSAECGVPWGTTVGWWAGTGVSCASEPCPTTACCSEDGDCRLFVIVPCTSPYLYSLGNTCDPHPCPVGACCIGNTCADLIEEACVYVYGGQYQGPGTTCSADDCQACCFEDGTCTDTTQALCIAAGGTPQGNDTTCTTDPCGACCDYYGACEVVPENVCLAAGGQWFGAGIGCVPDPCYGACCKIIAPYSCVLLLSEADCDQAGSNWRWAGYGTDCWDDPGDPDTIAEECE